MARPRLEITYCTQCRWLLRGGWMAQELLTTFERELGEVALVPGTGGVFEVRLDGELLWDRKERAGFPELPVLKRLVRDRVAPDRRLGHTDTAGKADLPLPGISASLADPPPPGVSADQPPGAAAGQPPERPGGRAGSAGQADQ
jgi:selenoprotein W-related protein